MDNAKNNIMEDSLLSDEDFVALMEAEYAGKTEPVNDLSKHLVWCRLRKKINKPVAGSLARFSYGVASLMLLLLVLPALWFDSTLEDAATESAQRYKGKTAPAPTVNLSVYRLLPDGELQNLLPRPRPGDTLVFGVKSTTSGEVALLLTINGQKPAIKLRTTLEQNQTILLKQGQNVFGYRVDQTDKSVGVCAVAAAQEQDLEKTLGNLTGKQWQRYLSDTAVAQCMNLAVQ